MVCSAGFAFLVSVTKRKKTLGYLLQVRLNRRTEYDLRDSCRNNFMELRIQNIEFLLRKSKM